MKPSPRIEILCRSYVGDRQTLLGNLCPTAAIFLDRERFPLSLVLDDESSGDHALGDALLGEGLVDRVAYEPLPDDWRDLFRGLAFAAPYNRWGYDRQQWSTFYFDRHSAADVIGVVDADATFFSYMTEENLLDPDGRIKLHVLEPPVADAWGRHAFLTSLRGSAYPNDPVALREPAPYETMWTDRMPMCFWRSTFANLRRHVAERWGVSFDAAFREFATGPFSQFNILVNYALRYESDRYVAVSPTERGRDLVTACQNKCHYREDIVVGGVHSFGLGPSDLGTFGRIALRAAHGDTLHLNRFAAELGNPCSTRDAERHYERVRRAVSALSPSVREAKVAALRAFMRTGARRVHSPRRMPVWLWVAGLDRYVPEAASPSS